MCYRRLWKPKLGYEKSERMTNFAYPAEVRKIIYTTNIIEGLNRQFRKITKNKPSFTNDDSLRKILYLALKKSCRIGQRYVEIGT